MMWKLLFVAFLAVSTLADIKLIEEEIMEELKNFCEKNVTNEKIENAQKAMIEFIGCNKALINPDTLQKDIRDMYAAFLNGGAWDEFIRKYCRKSSELKKCYHTMTSKVAPCLSADLRESTTAFTNATDQLLDYVCYRDGERIISFVAEGGIDCIQKKGPAILSCTGEDRVGSIRNAIHLTVKEECNLYDELTSCLVTAVRGCSSPIPGKVIEESVKIWRDGTCLKK